MKQVKRFVLFCYYRYGESPSEFTTDLEGEAIDRFNETECFCCLWDREKYLIKVKQPA